MLIFMCTQNVCRLIPICQHFGHNILPTYNNRKIDRKLMVEENFKTADLENRIEP